MTPSIKQVICDYWTAIFKAIRDKKMSDLNNNLDAYFDECNEFNYRKYYADNHREQKNDTKSI